jgi:hypothetical protein
MCIPIVFRPLFFSNSYYKILGTKQALEALSAPNKNICAHCKSPASLQYIEQNEDRREQEQGEGALVLTFRWV